MKLTHIIAIVAIAVAVGVIISTTGDASTYVSFKEASQLASEGKSKKVHVVGTLKKDPAGHILEMSYQPEIDPNHFTFSLVDKNHESRTVVYHNPKPQDFERSEQVVVVGSIQDNAFVAEKILMKCPSKYQDTKIKGADKNRPQASL